MVLLTRVLKSLRFFLWLIFVTRHQKSMKYVFWNQRGAFECDLCAFLLCWTAQLIEMRCSWGTAASVGRTFAEERLMFPRTEFAYLFCGLCLCMFFWAAENERPAKYSFFALRMRIACVATNFCTLLRRWLLFVMAWLLVAFQKANQRNPQMFTLLSSLSLSFVVYARCLVIFREWLALFG
jgi:hypothetical protein